MDADLDPAGGVGAPDRDLFAPWVALALLCSVAMWLEPGAETIPYHVAWAGFGLLSGIGAPWSARRTGAGLALFTGATGGILVVRAATGVIAWQETSEIPLMLLLVALMVWHVRRRQRALATATVLAAREAQRARDTERLTRVTSHELRTPLTIARGYVDLLRASETRPDRRLDLDVVDDELERLSRVGDRLIRVFRFQGPPERAPLDLDALLRQTAERWSAVAPRRWVVQTEAGELECSAERLRASLDTLVENALRYTAEGDTVRLFGRRTERGVELGVADSGPGMTGEQLACVNAGRQGETHGPGDLPRDALSQTGLGLGLVRAVAADRGGRIEAGRAPEGGAVVVLSLPFAPSTDGAGTAGGESPWATARKVSARAASALEAAARPGPVTG